MEETMEETMERFRLTVNASTFSWNECRRHVFLKPWTPVHGIDVQKILSHNVTASINGRKQTAFDSVEVCISLQWPNRFAEKFISANHVFGRKQISPLPSRTVNLVWRLRMAFNNTVTLWLCFGMHTRPWTGVHGFSMSSLRDCSAVEYNVCLIGRPWTRPWTVLVWSLTH